MTARRTASMFLLLNGAFGVGKSTVARELSRLLPGSVIFDPEWIGVVLQRLPGGRVDDFQDLVLWRRLTVALGRMVATFRAPVIVPMTFSDPAYLDEIRRGLARSRRPVYHVCLTAPLAVVRERLEARGEPFADPRWAWVHRRAAECCAAHQSDLFAPQIQTLERTPTAVAVDIAERLKTTTTALR